MLNFKFIIVFFILTFLTSGCKTIKQKTDSIIEKENQKLSKYIGKSSSVLQIDLGKPDEDFKNDKGNLVSVSYTHLTLPTILLV